MKLINKKTGEIGNFVSTNFNDPAITVIDDNGVQLGKYDSLAELNEEWQDYEEHTFFMINAIGTISEMRVSWLSTEPQLVEFGNYFETLEEAEKALAKLKAWKRLKDRGFRFDNFVRNAIYFVLSDEQIQDNKVIEDLDLLFGGE